MLAVRSTYCRPILHIPVSCKAPTCACPAIEQSISAMCLNITERARLNLAEKEKRLKEEREAFDRAMAPYGIKATPAKTTQKAETAKAA